MNASVERHALSLARPFTIARGTQTAAEVVRLRLAAGDQVGWGAAAPSRRYGETAATVEAALPDLLAAVEGADPLNRQGIARAMGDALRENPAARAAVDVALHDLAGKRADLPLYRLLGLDPHAAPATSFTVGIDDPATTRERAREAVDRGFGTLKVKVGDGRGRERLAAVREAAPDVTLRVDANEAWSPREAAERIEALAAFGLEFVEQPVPADDREGLGFVRERSPVPVAADESCLVAADVPELAGCADVVVVKLMKCGGVREALRLIHAARARGLEVMLGCMVESAASLAAAHLAPLADYADLDGALLLADGADPFEGVPIDGDGIHLAALDRPGTGARPAE